WRRAGGGVRARRQAGSGCGPRASPTWSPAPTTPSAVGSDAAGSPATSLATETDCSCAGPRCSIGSTRAPAGEAAAGENEEPPLTAIRRTPVDSRGRRVPGLYVRTTRDEREVYEYRARLDGRVVTYKLDARSPTEAVAEIEQLRSEVRRNGLAVTDRRLTVAQVAERFREAVDADESYSPRTREDIRRRLDLHIVPALGPVRVCDLD